MKGYFGGTFIILAAMIFIEILYFEKSFDNIHWNAIFIGIIYYNVAFFFAENMEEKKKEKSAGQQ